MRLPIFPSGTGLVNAFVGVLNDGDMIHYLLYGAPIYFHDVSDHNKFRYVTSHLIELGHCSRAEVIRFFSVSESSVYRWLELYRDKGESGFFGLGARSQGGVAHKMTPAVMAKAQSMLENGQSVSSIGRELKMGESAVRYHITQGSLKKKA